MAKRRIAILGGGPSALATAFDLAKDPEAFDLTVYALGWRLGGKCASGRNALAGMRNEEHGLHLPMGFYENTFDQMRQAYDEVGPALGRLSTWKQAFLPRSTLTLAERMGGAWNEWPMHFPQTPGVPGDRARAAIGGRPEPPPTLAEIVQRMLRWLQGYADDEHRTHPALSGHYERFLEHGPILGALSALERVVVRIAEADVEVLLDAFGFFLRDVLWPIVSPRLETDLRLRKLWILMDVGFASARGLLHVAVAGGKLADLDGVEFTRWLDDHAAFPDGLRPASRGSAPLRMVYELVFAYRDGDTTRPSIAAGVALRGLMRLVFGYSGSVTYDLAAGMGETVITPYYEAIRKRNPAVRFEFFSRVRRLELSPDGALVNRIVLGIQARPITGTYAPTVECGGLHVWPSRPRYELLREGAELQRSDELPGGGFDLESSYTAWADVETRELVLGTDFDGVVLSIPPPALGVVAAELRRDPRWRDMMDHVTGVPTAAMQLSVKKSAAELGWTPARSESPEPALIGSYADYLGTIADATRVVSFEGWPEASTPAGEFYFCGPFPAPPPPPIDLPAPDYILRCREQVIDYARRWSESFLGWPFPGLIKPGGLDTSLLVDLTGGTDPFAAQYFRAGVNPGESYVTSFPGTTVYRLKPDSRVFANLLLAGDWTDNGMNAGALEAAVTSGRIVARALVGGRYPIYGEGDGIC